MASPSDPNAAGPDEDSKPYPWEEWRWDESLFAGTAPFYRQGRPPYAADLAKVAERVLGLDGRGRLLDVGCGPGIVALDLAGLFDEVVGIDPDPGMIAEAQAAASERRVANAHWVQLRAEDLPAGLGMFRIVAFAQSFHWMNRPVVAGLVRNMLDPGGVVIQVDASRAAADPGDDAATRHALIPREAIDQLRVRYLGPNRRAGQGFRNTSPSGEDKVFQAAGFLPMEQHRVPEHRELVQTSDDIVAWVFSTSSTAPHLFGDDLASFEHDLRELLASVSPEGLFSTPLRDSTLRLWRLPDPPET